MQRVLSILRDHLQGETFTVDHPRRTLEEFFLDVINQAKADSIETAGVIGGGRIAEYLTQPGDNGVLTDLLKENTAPVEAAPAAEPAADTQTAEATERALGELTGETAMPAAAPAAPAAPDRSEELAEADKKLNDLLGKQKQE